MGGGKYIPTGEKTPRLCDRTRIRLKCQSFRKVRAIIADGRDTGQRPWGRGTNIVTVPPISGQLATMDCAGIERWRAVGCASGRRRIIGDGGPYRRQPFRAGACFGSVTQEVIAGGRGNQDQCAIGCELYSHNNIRIKMHYILKCDSQKVFITMKLRPWPS